MLRLKLFNNLIGWYSTKENFSKYFRINDWICRKKDINSFINITIYINEINKSEDIIKYIQLFILYYKFRSS